MPTFGAVLGLSSQALLFGSDNGEYGQIPSGGRSAPGSVATRQWMRFQPPVCASTPRRLPTLGHPLRRRICPLTQQQIQLRGMMLHMPHVIEEQFRIAHRAIIERTRRNHPGFGHSRHHGVQLFAAVLEVGEQFVFCVGALRRDALVCEFRQTERRRRTKLRFAFLREIHVEKKEGVKRYVPERARWLTGPDRIRAGLDRVPEHIDRSMKLLPDCGSPKVDHGVGCLSHSRSIDEWATSGLGYNLTESGDAVKWGEVVSPSDVCGTQQPDQASILKGD
jgi:hypothetical protein